MSDSSSFSSESRLHQAHQRTQQVWRSGRDQLCSVLEVFAQQAISLVQLDQEHPVRPTLDAQSIHQTLQLELPSQGRDLHEVFDHVCQVMKATPSTGGPRFFNQLFGGHDPISTPADLLASLGNQSMYTYKVAGPLVWIENELIRRLGQKVGYTQGGGIFAPGGSLSNLAAMLCARDALDETARQEGMSKGYRLYTSAESHYSISKGAGIMGLGRGNVVKVKCDHDGRMDPAALKEAIAADRKAGFRPMMINGTAGTTVRGAFDPFDALGMIAQEEQIWFHIDGAFGGTALWSTEMSSYLKGAERADSFTWDAHKAMGVPLTCSVLLTKDAQATSKALSENADYLFQGDSDWLNPGTRSLQCGRRNDALKLWAAWQYYGDQGWQERIERQRDLTLVLADLIQQRPHFKLTEPPHYLNVCFEYEGHSSESICAALQKECLALVGYGTVRGRTIIRPAVMNPELTRHDLIHLLDSIEHVAQNCDPV